ncbi:SARP family transcriptional regulator [Pseudonocardia saturnea]|uniref:SARP family transcriptional regulator n=1 Tax=Pseudonocardia saturnea TaxID=33909 RepID=A0ABQ0RUY1_9PSEU|nr:SARP family transcriptional regulator [Pseudonocardia autotrophica]GEC24476.1 SARP family transcriptional regulator [Pseudonocardia saturnea]
MLGPLDVVQEGELGDRSLLPTATKKRKLLAVLLSRVGEVVSTAALMDEIWDEGRPRKARAALHVYLAQLRNGLADGTGATIETDGPGYALRLDGASLDHHDFSDLVGSARKRHAAGDLDAAASYFEQALAHWRGSPLAGLTDGPVLSVYATCLNEEYVQAVESRLEIDLQRGRHREVVSELIRLVHDYPLREAFHRQLMIAYYRSERQADALSCFLELRGRLQEELGVEPCRPIQQLHRAVLAADPALDHETWSAAS